MPDTNRDPQEIQGEITGLINLLSQRDNDALEAIDKLVIAVSDCESPQHLGEAILECLPDFAASARNRIALRTEVRELIAELEPEGTDG